MKKTAVFLSLATCAVVAAVVCLCIHSGIAYERGLMLEARRVFPGYSFVFEGKTNVIRRAGTMHGFVRQHPMVAYLDLFVEYFKEHNWKKENPFRIEETDDLVILTLPPYQELLGLKNCFGSDYNLQVIIDKKKRVVVSALCG